MTTKERFEKALLSLNKEEKIIVGRINYLISEIQGSNLIIGGDNELHSCQLSTNSSDVMNQIEQVLDNAGFESINRSFLCPAFGRGTHILFSYLYKFVFNSPSINSPQDRLKSIINNEVLGIEIDETLSYFFLKRVEAYLKSTPSMITGDYLRSSLGDFQNLKPNPVILINPPYDVGLLDRDSAIICKCEDKLIADAAKTRIDAAFIVHSYENFGPETIISTVFPVSWTQLKSWSKFRKWIFSTKSIQKISVVENKFEDNPDISPSIVLQLKGSDTNEIQIENDRRSSFVFETPVEDEIIPHAYGEIGKEVFQKMTNFPEKIEMYMPNKWKKMNISGCKLYITSAYGLGGMSSNPYVILSDFSENTRCNLGGPLKDEPGKHSLMIVAKDEAHSNKLKKWWKDPIKNFYLNMRSIDYHNNEQNIGMIPDPTKNMKGDYSQEKAAKIFGFSSSTVDFINRIYNGS